MTLFITSFQPETIIELRHRFEGSKIGESPGIKGGKLFWLHSKAIMDVHREMIKELPKDCKYIFADPLDTVSDCIAQMEE